MFRKILLAVVVAFICYFAITIFGHSVSPAIKSELAIQTVNGDAAAYAAQRSYDTADNFLSAGIVVLYVFFVFWLFKPKSKKVDPIA